MEKEETAPAEQEEGETTGGGDEVATEAVEETTKESSSNLSEEDGEPTPPPTGVDAADIAEEPSDPAEQPSSAVVEDEPDTKAEDVTEKNGDEEGDVIDSSELEENSTADHGAGQQESAEVESEEAQCEHEEMEVEEEQGEMAEGDEAEGGVTGQGGEQETEDGTAPVDDEVGEEGEVEEEEEEESGNPREEEEEEEDDDESATLPPILTRKRTLSVSSGEDGPKRKVGRSASAQMDGAKDDKDKYCWVCHKDSVQINCKLCPRSYHQKCMTMDYPNAKISQGDSTCPECVVVMNAETKEFRSDAMKQLSIEQLMGLLKNICLRMRQTPGSDPFVQPVDPTDAEDYFDYIIYPMDIETLEKNIKKRQYGSTEAFLADAQWLVHNSIVFNSASSHYTVIAKRLLKVCKQELTEIETCPECYTNAHEKPDSWFVEACRRPHMLVWAKLKGFPFWPAKAMKIKDNDVDVRFFGQHDRAWVSMKDCFLYSEEMPVAPPKKNGPLLSAIEELTAHVDKLKEVHGPVVFSTVKTPIGPQLSVDQIRRMLPEYTPPEQPNQQKGSSQAISKNNNNKVPPPKGKSPMTIRISSLKTNPTIVNISPGENSEARVTRLTRKSSALSTSNVSESDASTEDAPQGDATVQDEKPTETGEAEGPPVPEKYEPEEEHSPSVPKGSEILANALGVRRSTRGSSRSGDSSTTTTTTPAIAAEGTTTSATPTLEKRLTRGSLKAADAANDSGNDGDHPSDEQPPDSVLEAMGLSKKTKDSPSGLPTGSRTTASLVIKGEPMDVNDNEDELEDATATSMARNQNKAAHSLMEQISAHTTGKGYRFNLSKDISISAVEGGDHEDLDGGGASQGGGAFGMNMRARRPVTNVAQQGRAVPPGIPMGSVIRPRGPMNPAGTVNGGGGQRIFTGQQLRQMVRNARPQQILNPRTGVRITGNPPRPMSMMSVRGQHVVQKNPKEQGVVVDSSSLRIEGQQVNPVQGPITLPGGTITVTPLTSLISGVPITTYGSGDGVNGAQTSQVAVALKTSTSALPNNIGIINVQQQQSGGTTIVNNSVTSGKSVKNIQPSIGSAQQRRNLMVSIPPSVSMHLQNLTKTMGDLVKSTVEQITMEVVEYCNASQGKQENSRLQLEIERLQNKLNKEVTDVKHNNDIAMRELRMSMENDKKRAVAELKRQMDVDKQKAIEDTKKKQWCANCGREALFYCCWNTSYCGYPCQEEHWPTHMSSCSQSSTNSR